MAQMLKESTAVDVLIGPFVDILDGAAAETGESPTVKLSKNGQALAAKNDVTTPVSDADGYYNCELDATDTNTVGTLVLTVAASATALPVRHEFQVVETNVYDALYASGADGFGTDGVTLATSQGNYAPAKAGDSMALSAGAITNASLAGNMEIVFETDFATNYNTTRNAWATNTQDFVGTAAADPFNGQVVAASVTGAVGSVTGAVGSVTGSVGSVTGAVGSVTAGVSLAAGAVTDASLAGNMEIVFETDFATNYNVTRNAWATNAQDFVGTTAADPFNGQVIAASVTGAVGSVTGAVGSVTGNVGGTINGLTATALADMFDTDSGTTYGAAAAGSVVKEIADNAGGSGLTEAGIADAVWDEDLAVGHAIANSAAVKVKAIETDTGEIGTAGAGLTNINLPNQTMDITGDITGNLSGSVGSVTGAVGSVTGAVGSVTAEVTADVTKVSGSATAADALELSTETIISGTAQTGTLSTIAMTTNLTIAVADQYKGRIIIFQSDTTTAALRNQATDITSCSVTNGELGFTALTTAPVNGDSFIII